MRFNLLKNISFRDDYTGIKDANCFGKSDCAPSGNRMIFKDAFIWRLADI